MVLVVQLGQENQWKIGVTWSSTRYMREKKILHQLIYLQRWQTSEDGSISSKFLYAKQNKVDKLIPEEYNSYQL